MARPTLTPNVALMAAQDLPEVAAEAEVPEWVHLAPAGQVHAFDGRGPYEIADPQAVIKASFARRGDLEIDVNHATFKSAPRGGEAPARGWIVAMEARPDGIWGRVRWTEEGRRMVASRAYRRISPVFEIDRATGRRVLSILNASLTNRNNLRGLAALNSEEDGAMPLKERLAELFGLTADASEDAIFDAAAALLETREKAQGAAALQAEIEDVRAALGVTEDGDLLAAARRAGAGSDTVAALQAELADVAEELAQLREQGRRAAAECFIDGAIAEKRVGVSSQRDRLIAMHMENPGEVEALVRAMPRLDRSATAVLPPEPKDGSVALNAEQVQAARLLGLPIDLYRKQLEAERQNEGTV